MTDEQIMGQVKEGELRQLSHLFERYHRKLFSFFVRMNGDAALSEDFTQMVFERILKYRHSFKEDASFKTWIFQIGRNVYRDHYRLNTIKIDGDTEVSELNLYDETKQEEEEYLNHRKKQLEKAIAQLKPEYREVVLLGWIENLRYSEVADAIGITEANVKVRMHRAIKQLKKMMCA